MWGLVESGMVKEIGRISKHRLFCNRTVELVEHIFAALTAKVISPKPLNRDELMEDLLRPCDKILIIQVKLSRKDAILFEKT